jgi:hypothetical protein
LELHWLLFVPIEDQYVRSGFFIICHCLPFGAPHFGVSAWCYSALNIWAVMVVMFSEECVGEQKVGGLKKLGERV